MTTNEKAVILIKSLMQQLRTSDHTVFHPEGNIISDSVIAELEAGDTEPAHVQRIEKLF